MLAARNVSLYRGGQIVLDGVNVVIDPGSRVGIVGPNGIGKTTLLRLLAGPLVPDGGGGGANAAVARRGLLGTGDRCRRR